MAFMSVRNRDLAALSIDNFLKQKQHSEPYQNSNAHSADYTSLFLTPDGRHAGEITPGPSS